MKYYFTYGTDGQPFVGGWTEVEAPNVNLACAAFRLAHPDKEPGILNCSSTYTEENFLKSCMETSESSATNVSASRSRSSHVTRMSLLILNA